MCLHNTAQLNRLAIYIAQKHDLNEDLRHSVLYYFSVFKSAFSRSRIQVEKHSLLPVSLAPAVIGL